MDRGLINKLTKVLGVVSVGLPVTLGLSFIILTCGLLLFFLLLVSIVLISAPITGNQGGPLTFIMTGLPSISLMFFGFGFMCITVIFFLGFILLFKITAEFIREMYETIMGRKLI